MMLLSHAIRVLRWPSRFRSWDREAITIFCPCQALRHLTNAPIMQVYVPFAASASGTGIWLVPHLTSRGVMTHPLIQVCVPFAASAAAEFDPEAVPTVAQLLEELPALSKPDTPAGARLEGQRSEWGCTALAGCMTSFCR